MSTQNDKEIDPDDFGLGIAIVGMDGRFPESKDLRSFWNNLEKGKDCIQFFSTEELLEEGLTPEEISQKNYVAARGTLADVDRFDAEFFEYSPRDAALMDPQQRLFLETAWRALDNAGYGRKEGRPRTGVFASSSTNTYLLSNLMRNETVMKKYGRFQVQVLNQVDALATHTSYKLDLKGPSLSIQTACSSSLVGLHLACQSLVSGECDLALSGAVSVRVPHKEGYVYQETGIASPDGHCRPFDAKAAGTVGGCGVGIIALRRLEDAIADGDPIRAVIRGTAINNDGGVKVGFTAPSVDGQAEVIAEAMAVAECDFSSISYTEAHGTGTLLGDPIELAALEKAHRTQNNDTRYCRLGSVKSNIGHLDAAAGIAGIIKTVLAMENKTIPLTVNTQSENPRFNFAQSPFELCFEASEWTTNQSPRRAGVSSFGFGGTNAHVVLEESPLPQATLTKEKEDEAGILFLSAKSEESLAANRREIGTHIKEDARLTPCEASYSLAVGRTHFARRQAFAYGSRDELLEQLLSKADESCEGVASKTPRKTVFVFPGQGSQYAGMGKELYRQWKPFRESFDRVATVLSRQHSIELKDLAWGEESNEIDRTENAQIVLFSLELALAEAWEKTGLKADCFLGHSLGDYVSACMAGVFSPEDAIRLVIERGRIMAEAPEGAMVAVALGTDDLDAYLCDEIALAAVNGSKSCTLSGCCKAIDEVVEQFAASGIQYRRLATSSAFHSPLMKESMLRFHQAFEGITLSAPRRQVYSSCSGELLTEEEATDPDFWVSQIGKPVLFDQACQKLLAKETYLCLEVGPKTLGGVMKRGNENVAGVTATLPRANEVVDEFRFQQRALASLWCRGARIDWNSYYGGAKRRKVELPGYSFSGKSYWIYPDQVEASRKNANGIAVSAAYKQEPEISQSANESLASYGRPNIETKFLAPRNEVESRVADVWKRFLGIEAVGVKDDFFELGGDSLTGVQLVSELSKEFSISVSLDTLYADPTVSGFAKHVSEQTSSMEQDDDLESLLSQVEGLSEDELRIALGTPKK